MMTIGETFRYFRKSKNFTLGEVAQNIVTVPFLSRFERNQTDISVSRFFELLACIDITIEEFFSIYNNSSNHEFFEKLNLYFQSENIQGLQQMRDNLLTEYHNNQITKKHLQAIMISALLQRVTGEKVKESDARFLQDYLLKLNNWTFFELVLYANTMFLFNIEIVLLLTKRLFKKSLMYEGIEEG